MEFKNKRIYIVSREGWGKMRMSKHNYAIELAKLGNQVYFINHPDQKKEYKRGEIRLVKTDYENLYVINHRFILPGIFKSKFANLYEIFTRNHIKRLIKKTRGKPDIVWTFHAGNLLPLKYFPDCDVRIFMPVDGPFGDEDEMRSADDADVIVAVTNEILENFKNVNVPKFQINHGVADIFINSDIRDGANVPIRVGYSGSIIRNDLDFDTFIRIINAHPDKIFEFWGENDYMKSGLHLARDISSTTKKFVETLKSLPNVKLHGAVSPEILAKGLKNMDILFICYIFYQEEGYVKNDQNHHKVLEYLAAGKVIVTSYMSTYSIRYPGLMEMVADIKSNNQIPALFDKVVENLGHYNTVEKQLERIDFARQFTYARQIAKIQAFINQNVTKSKMV